MNKYRNVKTTLDGIIFDSKKEAARYQELFLLQRGNVIKDLDVHPTYVLQPAFKSWGVTHRAITYEGDFSYSERGVHVVEDVKAIKTEVFRIKEKMFRYKYPEVDFRIINVKK